MVSEPSWPADAGRVRGGLLGGRDILVFDTKNHAAAISIQRWIGRAIVPG